MIAKIDPNDPYRPIEPQEYAIYLIAVEWDQSRKNIHTGVRDQNGLIKAVSTRDMYRAVLDYYIENGYTTIVEAFQNLQAEHAQGMDDWRIGDAFDDFTIDWAGYTHAGSAVAILIENYAQDPRFKEMHSRQIYATPELRAAEFETPLFAAIHARRQKIAKIK